MATRTRNQSNRQSETRKNGSRGSSSGGGKTSSSASTRRDERSAFSWGEGAGPIIGAAIAGAALGIAANLGRKFVTQAMSAAAGDWDEVLAAEHEMTLAIFDKMLATDDSQTFKRRMLVKQLTHALDKHAHQEENVIYPALREAGQKVEADELNGEHGYVKTYLYDLNRMAGDDPRWIDKVREFRAMIAAHARMEEERVFPGLKDGLDAQTNARITSLMNRDGFWQA